MAIVVVIIITQSAFLAMAAVLKPWLSGFLNFLEVTCGLFDVATMIIIAVAYRAKMVSTVEQMVGISQVRLAKQMCRCDQSTLWLLVGIVCLSTAHDRIMKQCGLS